MKDMNADNLLNKTRSERRARRKHKVMRVHGSGMKILASQLTARKGRSS